MRRASRHPRPRQLRAASRPCSPAAAADTAESATILPGNDGMASPLPPAQRNVAPLRRSRVASMSRAQFSASHLPLLKRYIVTPPSRMSPFLSNAMVPVMPCMFSFRSVGRYFSGSAEPAVFIASISAIVAS